jgi:4-azaleucine resistance transporter AzlC
MSMARRHPSLVEGMRDGLSPAGAAFVLALSYGAASTAAGWGVLLPVVSSMVTFSGSAQFTLLTTLSVGSALTAVTAAVLINARYVVMSVALNDSLHGGRVRRALRAQALVDASFVVAHRGDGRFDASRLIGATIPQWICWVTGTAVGALARPSAELMHSIGADVAFPAFFLLLALDELRSARACVAAVLGGCVAAALLFVTDPGVALLGATSAAVVGALPDLFRREQPGGRA